MVVFVAVEVVQVASGSLKSGTRVLEGIETMPRPAGLESDGKSRVEDSRDAGRESVCRGMLVGDVEVGDVVVLDCSQESDDVEARRRTAAK